MVSEMNHVQAIKNQFERLNVSDAVSPPQLRDGSSEIRSFKRAATLMDFSNFQLNGEASVKSPPQFQRQDSNSKSVRRRGAFRLEKKPEVVKSPKVTDDDCDIDDEMQYLATSETIKKALKQPLPLGSPPKKPPRTFASTPLNSPIAEVREFVPTPPKVTKLREGMKLLNCIISPCSIDPIYYEQIRAERRALPESDSEEEEVEEEQIYMEPTLHKFDVVTKKQPEELHYMCTNIIDQSYNTNDASSLDSCPSESQCEEVQNFSKVR
jgi:hypothetical protein